MRTNWIVASLVAVLMAAAATDAVAQEATATALATRKLESVADTSLVSPIVGTTPVFNVESTADETTANALLGVQYGDLSLSVKFAGPIRKGSPTQFADLDGLRNKASVDFGIGWLYWTAKDPAPDLLPACQRLADIVGKSLAEVDCSLSGLKAAQREHTAVIVPLIDPGNAFFLTARVKGAREDFDFVTADTLTAASERKSSSALVLAVGWLTRSNWMLGANYRHEDAFSAAGDPVAICWPAGSTAATTCSDAVVGAPVRSQSELFQIEVRKFLGSGLAISPRFTRNVTKSISGFELPLYFIKAGDASGLTGGVTTGWRSDQRGPSIVVFVGQALGIWNR
jgi:hypothetical protein